MFEVHGLRAQSFGMRFLLPLAECVALGSSLPDLQGGRIKPVVEYCRS